MVTIPMTLSQRANHYSGGLVNDTKQAHRDLQRTVDSVALKRLKDIAGKLLVVYPLDLVIIPDR